MDVTMTDNEIIKALEICQQTETMGDCERLGCPAWTQEGCYYACINDSWHDALVSDALSLINRQKAEVERLYHEKYPYLGDVLKETKADAIKEFAERLKEEITEALRSNYNAQNERIAKTNTVDEFVNYCDGKIAALRGIDDFIDNLVKEMVGDDNG